MANKANEDFYYNLSRKELQSLCKRYGLPANKSHSDLARSLVAYLEEGFGGPMYNFWENFHAQRNGSGLSRNESLRKCSGENFLGLSRNRIVENVPEIECREINADAFPAHNAIGCSMETPTKAPSSSYQFYVRSEEGINLYVDLNSSLSDWTKRFKNEVFICENMHSNKSQSLHQDLGCVGEGDKEKTSSILQNIDVGNIEDGQQTKSDHVGLDQPIKVGGFLVTSEVRPCNIAVDVSEHITEDQELISSKIDSGRQKQIFSGANSYSKDGCTLILDSDVSNNVQKSVCDSVISISEDQLSPITMEHQNSKLDNCQNSTLQNHCSHADNSVVYLGYPASASIDMQSSEVMNYHKCASCSPCGNEGLVGLFDPKDNTETEKGELASSCELDPGTFGNYVPTSAEGWERSNITNGTESPRCPQLTISFEKNCFCYDNLESNEQLSKKRKHIEEHQSGYGKPDAEVLRSMKHITREVLPRRSVRLITKLGCISKINCDDLRNVKLPKSLTKVNS